MGQRSLVLLRILPFGVGEAVNCETGSGQPIAQSLPRCPKTQRIRLQKPLGDHTVGGRIVVDPVGANSFLESLGLTAGRADTAQIGQRGRSPRHDRENNVVRAVGRSQGTFVIGLEPSNGDVHGQQRAIHDGVMDWLEPGEQRSLHLELEVLPDADAVSGDKFAQWLDAARSTGPQLDAKTYADLAKPSAAVAPFTYRSVAPGLFDSIMVSEMQSDDAMCRRNPTSMRAEK